MPMKTCIDCGMVFPAENSSAKRCCLCVAKHRAKEASVKVYPKPAVDALTRDVRLADAAGKSYGMRSTAKRKRGRANEYREV